MKHPRLAFIAAALLLAACTSKQPKSTTPAPQSNPIPANAENEQPIDTPPVMSQDEADAQAAKAIQKENADAELEKLKKELAGG